MFEFLFDPSAWAALVTLTVLEIVLGIDNIILIAILADKLPEKQRPKARKIGLAAALVTRILLLSLVFMIAHIMVPLFTLFGHEYTIRDLILIMGGLFLLAKGTAEIHEKIEGEGLEEKAKVKSRSFSFIIIQIALMDIVFSFDSVITAIGIADHIEVMVIAVVLSIIVMVLAVDWISEFINSNPTLKVLAMSYMLLIGLVLIGEGVGQHIPKGYLYFAMGFSFGVELINMAVRRNKSRGAING